MRRKVAELTMNTKRSEIDPCSRSFLMERICEQIKPENHFDLDEISNQMALDGGFDFSGTSLTVNEISTAWNSCILKNELAFFLSETLAFYCANENLNSKNQFVAWIVATIISGDLIRKGYLDLELEMAKILILLSNCRNKLPSDLVTELALEIF